MCQKTSVSVASEDPHVPVCDSMQHVLQRGKANAINGPSFGLEIVGYTLSGMIQAGTTMGAWGPLGWRSIPHPFFGVSQAF
jgi:hypothetical protein